MGRLRLDRENLLRMYLLFRDFDEGYMRRYGFQKLLEVFGEKLWNWERLFNRQEVTVVDLEPKAVLPTLDLESLERMAVLEALARSNWVQKEAAKMLGISQRRMYYKANKLGLTHPSWKKLVPEILRD